MTGIMNPLHLAFIAMIALIFLGPKRLPELAKTLGSGMREFRETMSLDHTSSPPPAYAPEAATAAVATPLAPVPPLAPALATPMLAPVPPLAPPVALRPPAPVPPLAPAVSLLRRPVDATPPQAPDAA
ncbi:MAG TPA: twin-arginine translocase TatA/TatE family subunit [Solirubrobacteraceae bacterium]